MALRALELGKTLEAKRAELLELETRSKDFETREADLAHRIETAETEEEKRSVEVDIETLNADKRSNEESSKSLRSEIAQLEKDLKDIEDKANAEPIIKEERKIEHMENMEIRSSKEYLNAYVKAIKTENDAELRALLTENATDGTVPVPTYVENRIRAAWEKDEIMSLVRRTNIRGNLKVGFEISSTGAVFHVEGTAAPDEEALELGIVTLIPATLKKWIDISTEAMSLAGEEFLAYVVDEIMNKIAKAAADALVDAIASLPTTATATSPAAAVVKEAPAIGTIANAIAHLADDAANPVIVMNKLTWAAFKAAQYAGQYNVDPFEGLRVVFNNSLKAYSAAAEDDVYAIVGDFGFGAQANFPAGYEIEVTVDRISQRKKDLVEVVGSQYVALGVVCNGAFVNITKPASI